MNPLSKSELIQKGKYFTPAQQITVPANGSISVDFQGYNGRIYGLNRFIIGGSSLESILATAKLINTDGKTTIFENIQLNVIQQLFLARSLRGAFIIEPQTQLELTLTNVTGADIDVNVELAGYSDVQLNNLKAQYECKGASFPKPVLVSTKVDVAAGATDSIAKLSLPASKLRLYRMALRSDSDANIQVKVRYNKYYIKPLVYLSQINDEFKHMDMILPIDLESTTPFELYLTNLDGAALHTVSFLAETYKV